MPSFPPKKNAAFTIYLPILDADGDPVAAAAGLSSTISGDGAAFAAGPAPVEEGEGFYSIALTAANMNFDNISGVLKTTTTGAKNTPFSIYTVTRQMDDLAFPNISGRGVDVDATGGVEITANQAVNAAQWAGAATATDDVALATAPANFAALSLTVGGLVTLAGVTHTGAVIPTVTTLTGHTAQTGDNFARLGAPTGVSVSADVAAVKTDTAAILVDTGTTLDGRIPAVLVGGRMDASIGAMAANVITAAAHATGAIDAAALAADAGTEIAAAVWNRDATLSQTQGTFGQAIGDPVLDADTIWGLANTNLDAAVSTRMATYVQPTGFLAATFPTDPADQSLIIAATDAIIARGDAAWITAVGFATPTNITAGTITTTTNLTNLPSIPADWITAAGLAADASTEIGTAVWASGTRLLTAGTGIVLAKGVGVTGFNDLSSTDIVTGGAITTSGGIASADIKKVNAITVTGVGTAASPWGPA